MSRSIVLDTMDATLIVPDGGERYKPTHPDGLQHAVADLPAMCRAFP